MKPGWRQEEHEKSIGEHKTNGHVQKRKRKPQREIWRVRVEIRFFQRLVLANLIASGNRAGTLGT